MRYTLLFSTLVAVLASCNPPKEPSFDPATEEKAIREVLGTQEQAWNRADIDAFMEGYWKSDSLQFIGSQVTRGWDSTLVRYKRNYSTPQQMGKLRFEFYEFQFLSPTACLVTGRYNLTRETDAPTGMFTLVLRKKEGKWLIIYDHTS